MEKWFKHLWKFWLPHLAILAVLPLSCTMRGEYGNVAQITVCLSLNSYTCLSSSSPSAFSPLFDSSPYYIFIYNDDAAALLDSMEKVQGSTDIRAASTSGPKRVVVICGLRDTDFTMEQILSRSALEKVFADIRREDPARPVMVGESHFVAGEGRNVSVGLSPLLCRISIRNFEVDFSGTPYAGEKLSHVRAYITNTMGLCPIVESEYSSGIDILNSGGLDSLAMKQMAHPEMLLDENFGSGSCLYCYPSRSTGGIPPARLVIEGRIRGKLYYYPITLADGILERGKGYNYSIRLTRSGTTDPDTPLEKGTVIIKTENNDWYETGNEVEDY